MVRSQKIWNLIGQLQVTWKRRAQSLVQQHESWQILQPLSFLIPVGADGSFSRNRLLLYYFESLFTATCSSSKYVFLKTFHNSQENTCVGVSCYFFNTRLRYRCFLVNFAKLSRIQLLQTTLGLLLLWLLNISVISQNIVLISQSDFFHHLRHS